MRRAAPSALLLLALLAPSVRGEPGPAEPSPSSLTDAERPALGPALRAIERGHYATAVRALKRPAQRGDPLAQNNLGYLYEHGLGVARSDADALGWYARAAEAGLPVAQFNLAMMLLRGKGIPADPKAAATWFAAAAGAGHAGAEYMTGECYRSGSGVPRDGALALSWYLKAARQGHAGAQLMAASVYHSGEGWRREPQKAMTWAELARLNGEMQAASLQQKIEAGLKSGQKAEAIRQAQVCLRSGYRECPE
jgi:TPR repeat protein